MITRICFILCALAIAIPSVAAEPRQMLVTPQWLSEHQNDANIVILHVSQGKRDYDKAHIPNARFLWIGWFALSNPYLSFELLPLGQLDTTLEGLGISNTSRIVLCGSNGNVSQVARAYITLDYLGLGENTVILDGGIEEWKSVGKQTTTDVPIVKRTSLMPIVHKNTFVDAGFVQKHINNTNTVIIDARAPDFYNATSANGFPRAGHIPSATNIFFSTLFDSTNKYLPIDSLRTIFSRAGVVEGKEIISYCHVGQTASPLYIVARMLGYVPHLYDGSFEDWSNREDLPITKESKK